MPTPPAQPLYRALAQMINARQNCIKKPNPEWLTKHTDTIRALVKEHMPSGSGIDTGTSIDIDKSTEDKLIFFFSYHHMNEGGMYDGWTEHVLTVRPSLAFTLDLNISGRDRNQIKDYLYDVFREALTKEVTW